MVFQVACFPDANNLVLRIVGECLGNMTKLSRKVLVNEEIAHAGSAVFYCGLVVPVEMLAAGVWS